jgi:hypothetical protein
MDVCYHRRRCALKVVSQEGRPIAGSLQHELSAQRNSPARSPARWRKILRAVYFVVCNTLLLCILIEVVWRVGGFSKGTQSDVASTSRLDVPYALHPFFQTTSDNNPEILTGAFLSGWRADPLAEAESTGRTRVMFLGGSTTADVYPHYVRVNLDRDIGPTTAYNFGCNRHCSLHSLLKFWTYCDEVQPDLVVVLENVNDFYRGFTSPDTSLTQYRTDYSHSSGPLNPFWVRGQSRFNSREVFYSRPAGRFEIYESRDTTLAGLFKALVSDSAVLRTLTFSRPGSTQTRVEFETMPESLYLRSLPAFERNMRNLARSCKEKGVPVLFLTMPFTIDSSHTFLPPGNFFTNDGLHDLTPEQFADGMRRFNDVVRSLADEPGVYVYDAAAAIVDKALFLDEVHMSDGGQNLEGRLVAHEIVKRKMLTGRAR